MKGRRAGRWGRGRRAWRGRGVTRTRGRATAPGPTGLGPRSRAVVDMPRGHGGGRATDTRRRVRPRDRRAPASSPSAPLPERADGGARTAACRRVNFRLARAHPEPQIGRSSAQASTSVMGHGARSAPAHGARATLSRLLVRPSPTPQGPRAVTPDSTARGGRLREHGFAIAPPVSFLLPLARARACTRTRALSNSRPRGTYRGRHHPLAQIHAFHAHALEAPGGQTSP